MNLLKDIRNELISEKKLSVLLRKAKVLSSVIRNDDLKNWVDNEMNGYAEIDKLPDYRTVPGRNFGDFFGPFGKQLKNAPIPIMSLPEELKEYATTTYIAHGVSTIDDLLKSGKNQFKEQWPADFIAFAGSNIMEGFNCLSAWKLITSSQLAQVLETARNKLLSLILELEEKHPDVETEADIAGIPKDEVKTIVNTFIYGSNNVVASGINVQQKVSIEKGNINSLLEYLKKIGVPETDRTELKGIIKEEKTVQAPNKFGPKLANWISKLTNKALQGAGKVTLQVITQYIIHAINLYYGVG
jgi:hypothetical protein